MTTQECHGISNQQHLNSLFNRLLRPTYKKTSKSRILVPCEGNPPVTGVFPLQRANNAERVKGFHVITSSWSDCRRPPWTIRILTSKHSAFGNSRSEPGVGVTQPSSPAPLFLQFVKINNKLVCIYISHPYLSGVTAAKLQWHLPNMNDLKELTLLQHQMYSSKIKSPTRGLVTPPQCFFCTEADNRQCHWTVLHIKQGYSKVKIMCKHNYLTLVIFNLFADT